MEANIPVGAGRSTTPEIERRLCASFGEGIGDQRVPPVYTPAVQDNGEVEKSKNMPLVIQSPRRYTDQAYSSGVDVVNSCRGGT